MDEAKARRWRVMVIVRERHLERPRIPDPAVETSLCRALIDAGYKVIDPDRIREIRFSEQVDRMMRGGPEAAKEAQKIGRRFGADVLISGEAFTQEEARRSVDTDLGPVARIQCRCRIELNGMRVDMAERIYSDSIQKTGSPEATVELASKICLEQGADAMADGLLKKLDRLAFRPSQHVELDIRGLSSLTSSNELVKCLGKLPGVLDVGETDFAARTLRTEVNLQKMSLRDFAALLESHPTLKRFRLRVDSANGSKIVASAKGG